MKIMHISDLHFSKEMHHLGQKTHSLEQLEGIQAIYQEENPDYLVITGDITDEGDPQSLLNAKKWLFGTVPVGDDAEIGLQLTPNKVFLIPGNHDAFNVTTPKSLLLLRQQSLENYCREFPSQKYQTISQDDFGCRYFWIECNETPLFICLVDSSYLGDPSKKTSGIGNIDRIACGKWLREQARTILAWYDLGVAGRLPLLSCQGQIPSSDFRRATKVLLMHHYLFEPKEGRHPIKDYYLRIKNKKEIIGNILMADFDLMLCGHKHVLSTDDRTYAQHLDKRATNRLLLSAFKRQLGLRSIPIETDSFGRYVKRNILNCAFIMGRYFRGQERDGLIDLIERHLHDASEFEQKMKEIFTDANPDFDELETGEIDGIVTAIQSLTSGQRLELSRVAAKQLRECRKALGNRKFLHIMSGSSSKMTTIPNSRALNIYDISNKNLEIEIRFKRYVYGPQSTDTSKQTWNFQVNEDGGERVFHLPNSRRGRG